jgi:hypothetical protein
MGLSLEGFGDEGEFGLDRTFSKEICFSTMNYNVTRRKKMFPKFWWGSFYENVIMTGR